MSIEQQLATHFWKITLRNRAVRWLLVVIGAGLVYAGVSGWQLRQKQQATRMAYQQQARRNWLNNPDKHPHRMAHYGHYAFRPKPPLSLFDVGVESYLGNTLFLEAHRQNTVNFSEAGFSTGLLRFGEISLAMIGQVLFPLLIVFLGFGSIATDRENGTLRLLLSQGVSWRQLIVGRSLGVMGIMLLLYVPMLLLTGGLWLAAQDGRPTGDEMLRLAGLAGLYGGYIGLCSVAAVAVSAVSRTAKTALVSLIGLWLMLAIVLPRASQALGAALYETPSKARFQAGVQASVWREGDSHNPADPHYKALRDSLLRTYGVDSVQKLPVNYSGLVMAEGEKITAAIYNRHFDTLQTTFDRQNRFTQLSALLNPYMALKNLSMALAGTDYAGYVDFQRQAETYRYDMAQHLNDLQIRLVSNRKPGPGEKGPAISKSHWQGIPDFQYRPPSVVSVWTTEWLSLLAVAGWLLLLAGLLYYVPRRLN